jgi:hypothetical protein
MRVSVPLVDGVEGIDCRARSEPVLPTRGAGGLSRKALGSSVDLAHLQEHIGAGKLRCWQYHPQFFAWYEAASMTTTTTTTTTNCTRLACCYQN